MTIKTKWFGNKIKGEVLENLIVSLGKKPEEFLKTNEENWGSSNVHGKVNICPTEKGFDVDLYVFRTDYFKTVSSEAHIMNGTLTGDNLLDFNDWSFYNPHIKRFEEHIQGELKLKC
ncbi:hypothetical protein KAI04_05115 [Candidatus Pacearchaeota archaeon]|nr:hypothetical protein [Candidatus Pacearchaeota archaeon]